MNEAETRAEYVNPALDAMKKSLLDQAFTGQLVTNCYQLEKSVGDKL